MKRKCDIYEKSVPNYNMSLKFISRTYSHSDKFILLLRTPSTPAQGLPRPATNQQKNSIPQIAWYNTSNRQIRIKSDWQTHRQTEPYSFSLIDLSLIMTLNLYFSGQEEVILKGVSKAGLEAVINFGLHWTARTFPEQHHRYPSCSYTPTVSGGYCSMQPVS